MIVVMCCTRNWYLYLATELYALLKHNEVKKIYLFIEDDEIFFIKDKRIEFININKTQKYINENSPNYNTKYSQMSYVRCFFSKLLNEKKVLYIDADAIVIDDIKDLWDIDLNDYALAGIKESGEWSKHLGIEGMNDKYINSGVLLMNLDLIRKEKLDDTMIELLNNKYYCYPDQDVINVVCKDKIKYVSNIYNSTETTGVVKNAKIIHYIREYKGWIKGSPRSDVWFRYYEELLERIDETMVKVQCISDYFDTKLGKDVSPQDDAFIVTSERAEQLVNANVCRIVEVIPEEPKEEKVEAPVEETPVEEVKPKKRTRKK